MSVASKFLLQRYLFKIETFSRSLEYQKVQWEGEQRLCCGFLLIGDANGPNLFHDGSFGELHRMRYQRRN